MRSKRITRHFAATVALAPFILLASGVANGQQPAATSKPSDEWQIRWSASDAFSGDRPDWKKWAKDGGLPETSSWYWRNEENVELVDGIAKLTLRHNPENGRFFTSGVLSSYRTFTYGYFEARIQGVDWDKTGACPSFWLYSGFDDKVGEGETVYCEIIWYVDGAEVARKPNAHWHCPKRVAVSLGLRRPFVAFQDNRNKSVDPDQSPEVKSRLPEFPVAMLVDYVRVWEQAE